MRRLLEEIQRRLPEDCRERVERAKSNYNRTIRDSIEEITRFKLNMSDASNAQHASIDIKVEDGFPAAIADFDMGSGDDIADLIGSYRRHIENLHRSAGVIGKLLERLTRKDEPLPECDEQYKSALATTRELATKLLEHCAESDFIERLLAIQDDILGKYCAKNTKGEVTLYWAAIGIVAELLEVDIEDLAVVTLIHELAHGYTHLGRDPDSDRWSYEVMMNPKNLPVVEGVAQYFTDLISEHIGVKKRPEVHIAYLKLRRRQRGVYRIHDRWVEEFSPLTMYAALTEYRRGELTNHVEFCQMLDSARLRNRTIPRDRHDRVAEDINRNGPLYSDLGNMLDALYIQIATGEVRFRKADGVLTDFALRSHIEHAETLASIAHWHIILSPDLEKTTQSLDKATVAQVFRAILAILHDPLKPRGDTIKRLSGDLKGLWRYRIGDRRLLFQVFPSERRILFMDFLPRSSAYDG